MIPVHHVQLRLLTALKWYNSAKRIWKVIRFERGVWTHTANIWERSRVKITRYTGYITTNGAAHTKSLISPSKSSYSSSTSNSDPTSFILNECETRFASGMERVRSDLWRFIWQLDAWLRVPRQSLYWEVLAILQLSLNVLYLKSCVRNSIESMCSSYSAFDCISWNRVIAYYSFTDLY